MSNSRVHLFSLGILLCVACVAHAEDKKETKYEFKVETVKAQPAMTVRFKVSTEPEEISAKYTEAFTALYTHVISNGGKQAGAPFGRYHSVKEGEMEIEAGLPVAKVIDGKGNIKAGELPTGKVVTTIHKGPYDKLGEAHEALQKYLSEKGYKASGGLWESYITDPSTESDSSKWQTKLSVLIVEKNAAKPE